jgi:hypothetical protein
MEHTLTKQDIVSAYFRLCRLQFGDTSYQPRLDHTFEYLKFDDLDIKGLIMSCEEVFGVEMGDPLAERPNINNLHGIFNVLMDKLVASGRFVPKRRRRLEEADEGTCKVEGGDCIAPEAEDEISGAPASEGEDPGEPVDVVDEDVETDEGDTLPSEPVRFGEDEIIGDDFGAEISKPVLVDSEDSERLPDPPAEIDLGGEAPPADEEETDTGEQKPEAENP